MYCTLWQDIIDIVQNDICVMKDIESFFFLELCMIYIDW